MTVAGCYAAAVSAGFQAFDPVSITPQCLTGDCFGNNAPTPLGDIVALAGGGVYVQAIGGSEFFFVYVASDASVESCAGGSLDDGEQPTSQDLQWCDYAGNDPTGYLSPSALQSVVGFQADLSAYPQSSGGGSTGTTTTTTPTTTTPAPGFPEPGSSAPVEGLPSLVASTAELLLGDNVGVIVGGLVAVLIVWWVIGFLRRMGGES